MAGGGGAGRKVAVAAVQFACTDTVSDNVATAERYGCIPPPICSNLPEESNLQLCCLTLDVLCWCICESCG
jgi:hypothetical protein